MKIEIDIPKEFEKDFNEDKFKDFFKRAIADLDNNSVLCGRYEKETLEMLKKAFTNSKKIEKQDNHISKETELDIRLDERNRIINQINHLLDLVPVNRTLDDIINNKPKELGQLMAYNKSIDVIEEGSRELKNNKSLFNPENCNNYINEEIVLDDYYER